MVTRFPHKGLTQRSQLPVSQFLTWSLGCVGGWEFELVKLSTLAPGVGVLEQQSAKLRLRNLWRRKTAILV